MFFDEFLEPGSSSCALAAQLCKIVDFAVIVRPRLLFQDYWNAIGTYLILETKLSPNQTKITAHPTPGEGSGAAHHRLRRQVRRSALGRRCVGARCVGLGLQAEATLMESALADAPPEEHVAHAFKLLKPFLASIWGSERAKERMQRAGKGRPQTPCFGTWRCKGAPKP